MIIPGALVSISAVIRKFLRPCLFLVPVDRPGEAMPEFHKFGGLPDVPPDFAWPSRNGQPLDFLLQVSLEDPDVSEVLGVPADDALLLFFYDSEDQPAGYDPDDQSGYSVIKVSKTADTSLASLQPSVTVRKEFPISFVKGVSLPHPDSFDFKALSQEGGWEDAFTDTYEALQRELSLSHARGGVIHKLGGHSDAIQGDLQLEAQLVSGGINCGDPSGYQSARAKELQKGAANWSLLLQLDSDPALDFEWGDSGRLYFLVRGGISNLETPGNQWAATQYG